MPRRQPKARPPVADRPLAASGRALPTALHLWAHPVWLTTRAPRNSKGNLHHSTNTQPRHEHRGQATQETIAGRRPRRGRERRPPSQDFPDEVLGGELVGAFDGGSCHLVGEWLVE